MSDDQLYFSYREVLPDDTNQPLGSFTVTIDFRLAQAPYRIARVTSVGTVDTAGQPLAQHKIMAEFDLSEVVRGTSTPNPKYFQYINWKDLGNL